MTWLFHLDTVETWAYADKVFTPEECQKIIDLALAKGKTSATITGTDMKGEVNHEVRKNSVVWLNEKDDLNWMYQRLAATAINMNKQFFGFDLFGFTEDIQFTEYEAPGEHYKKHIDKIYNGVSRKLSLVVQLTNPADYEDCDLEVYTQDKAIKMKRDQGTVLFFPSYTLHQVTPITKGTRHTLVAWMGGPNFK